MAIKSAYIVRTQIINIGDRPFHCDKKIRSIFHQLFRNKNCFTKMRLSILDSNRPVSLPSKPFIRNLGQICFNTRSAVFAWERELLAESLGGCEDYWDPDDRNRPTEYEEYDERYIKNFFGYNPELNDQRMNHLYFELLPPLFLKAKLDSNTQADGRVFIHFYPSGYIIIHLVIALKHPKFQDISSIREAIRETDPMRYGGRWTWFTRLGDGKLPRIANLIKKNVYKSVYTESPMLNKNNYWYYSLKFTTTDEAKKVASTLLKGKEYNLLNLGPYEYYDNYGNFKQSDYDDYLLSSNQGVICGLSPCRSRTSARRFFWKILTLYEFVVLKNHIYDDYVDFFNTEIQKLKSFRLSTLKITKDDVLRFSIYDSQIPEYLIALDKHIRSISPFYRKVYSSISNGTRLDKHREDVMKLVNEWESEVKQWTPSLVKVWEKVIAPIRSLLIRPN